MINVKVAYYRKKDWKRFLRTIDDRESMHNSWIEWHQGFLKLKEDLTAQGFRVFEVEVDVDELVAYCKKNRIKNDGKARSEFVTQK